MSKFILFTNGVLSARYDSLINGNNIPSEAVKVDDAVFFKTINEVDGQWTLNADGAITKEPMPPTQPYIPQIVSMAQARLALLQSGLLTTVNSAIAAGGDADKINWEFRGEVNRNDPLVQNMKVALNISESDLDNLFTLAASL